MLFSFISDTKNSSIHTLLKLPSVISISHSTNNLSIVDRHWHSLGQFYGIFRGFDIQPFLIIIMTTVNILSKVRVKIFNITINKTYRQQFKQLVGKH